jgi:hypothetical protein
MTVFLFSAGHELKYTVFFLLPQISLKNVSVSDIASSPQEKEPYAVLTCRLCYQNIHESPTLRPQFPQVECNFGSWQFQASFIPMIQYPS